MIANIRRGEPRCYFVGKRIDAVRIRVNVRSPDITTISESVDGKQHDLFFDGKTWPLAA